MKNTNELRKLKIQLLTAIARKDHDRVKVLQETIDKLEPGFIITGKDGTRHKMPSGWFEKYLKLSSQYQDNKTTT